jgi:NAD(P)H-hydrate epimerase
VRQIAEMRDAGALVVSLDTPSGLDATSGASEGGVVADLTLTFATVKRGHLLNRAACGAIAVLDIGLADVLRPDSSLALLVDHHWVSQRVPRIPFDAHKGSRRRLVILGGAEGMSGAVALAAAGAQRSGIGLVRAVVAQQSVPAVQSAAPQAIAGKWPESASDAAQLMRDWAHALVVGPGLGTTQQARSVFDNAIAAFAGPTLVDADGLNLLAASTGSLARIAASRPVVVTPHVAEMARLVGVSPEAVAADRFEIAQRLAVASRAVVLLKGVPTVVASPQGRVFVIAAGSPALAAGGSGDVLSGVAGTLLSQMEDHFEAAVCAAWMHGRAGEDAAARHSLRGATITHVLESLSRVWDEASSDAPYPVLAELPAID